LTCDFWAEKRGKINATAKTEVKATAEARASASWMDDGFASARGKSTVWMGSRRGLGWDFWIDSERRFARSANNPPFAMRLRRMGHPAKDGPPSQGWATRPRMGHPATRPPGQPATRPTGQPATRPTGQPATRPPGHPANRPPGHPATRPTGHPATRPPGQGQWVRG
jgi:hypothetical protein